MKIPEHLKYTKDHEWIDIKNDILIIGITDFAQRELGDIVYVDINTLDQIVEEGEIFGSIEAVKTVSDLFMPITGKIVEFNQILENEPEKINSDPYKEGWIIKVKIENLLKLDNLLDAKDYKKSLEQ